MRVQLSVWSGVFLLVCVNQVTGYCWQAGRNPGFSGPPIIQQVALDKVRVSWSDVITKRECADNFVVKYWQRSAPGQYTVTPLIDKDKDFVDIEVVPKVPYQFQAVAREDKGLIGGVDWNKSPTIDFKTSASHVYGPAPPHENVNVNSAETAPSQQQQQPPINPYDQQNIAVNTSEQSAKVSILGLSIEIFIILCVVGLILVLVVVGVIFKFAYGSRKRRVEDDYDDESDAESEDEERKKLDSEA